MAITFTWTVKHLNQDNRGYANTLFTELSGTDGTNTKLATNVHVFGGDDYKPYSSWQQADIDAFAETHRSDLEANINLQFAELTLKS
jgi:hypothetical protein